jgi:hypothetical protein
VREGLSSHTVTVRGKAAKSLTAMTGVMDCVARSLRGEWTPRAYPARTKR